MKYQFKYTITCYVFSCVYSDSVVFVVEDGHETKDLLLEWDLVGYEEEMQLPQFSLESMKMINTSVVYLIGTSPDRTSLIRLFILFHFPIYFIY